MLTEGEKLRALRLLNADMSWKAIGKTLGRRPDTVRKVLAKYRSPRVVKNKFHRQDVEDLHAMSATKRAAGIPRHAGRREVPSSVLEERAAVFNQEMTINQLLLGDPPVGRRALDQRERR